MTRREAEVLRWVAQGKTNPETAELCYISVRTVQKHLEHIYQKLGVESRTAGSGSTQAAALMLRGFSKYALCDCVRPYWERGHPAR